MQNISSDLYHLGIVEVMSVYKYRDLDTDRRALDLERNTYFFILRVSRVRLDACDRDFIFSHREITSAVANCNEKPQPESWGNGGLRLPSSDDASRAPAQRAKGSSENSKANRIETMKRSRGIWTNLFGGSKKNSEVVSLSFVTNTCPNCRKKHVSASRMGLN